MARKKLSLAGKYAVSLILVLMVFLPLLVTIISSLKIPGSLDAQSPLWISSSDMTLNNYLSVFKERYLVRAFTNTIKIVAVSIFFNVLVGSITAYCLERFEFRFKKIIYILFYLAMMVPTNIVEIARFQVIRGMGLYNTLGAPIVIYIAANLMQLYIYRQFISGISVSLDESAMLDGCGYFRIFAQIIFPLLTPATATARGDFFIGADLIIKDNGNGDVGVFAKAYMSIPVDEVYITIYLDRWDADAERWRQVTYYDAEFYAKDYPDGLTDPTVDITFLNQKKGYDYRLRGVFAAVHNGLFEGFSPVTAGIRIE